MLHFCIGMQLPKFPKLRDRLGALFEKLLLLGVENFWWERPLQSSLKFLSFKSLERHAAISEIYGYDKVLNDAPVRIYFIFTNFNSDLH